MRTVLIATLLFAATPAVAQSPPLNLDDVVRVKELADETCGPVNSMTNNGKDMTAMIAEAGSEARLTPLESLLLVQHCGSYLQGAVDAMKRLR